MCVSVLESHGADDDLPKIKVSNERCLKKMARGKEAASIDSARLGSH